MKICKRIDRAKCKCGLYTNPTLKVPEVKEKTIDIQKIIDIMTRVYTDIESSDR